MGRIDAESETLIPIGGSFDVAGTIGTHHGIEAQQAWTGRMIPIDMRQASRGEKLTNNRSHGSGGAAVVGMQVRRLTPRECERLQGFPDDYTLIPYRGKLAKDGPRYKALGNSMAVPVMRWIGRRIQMVDALT